ncbi:MAG: hypothetical protein K6A28_06115 [Bacteroidales bacterium]|nr:hypothetical protein [Bacteroidales bacterium]
MKSTGPLFYILLFLSCFVSTACSQAQTAVGSSDPIQELVEREAKTLRRDGWKVAPGIVPIETQLKENYERAFAKDEHGFDKYFMGEAMTTAENYDAARSQAATLAKLDMAAKIQTEVTEMIEAKVATSQLSPEKAVSVVETVTSCQNTVSQKIGRVITALNIYRELRNGNIQVRTVIYYGHEQALEVYKRTLREALEMKADDLADEVDQLLGL